MTFDIPHMIATAVIVFVVFWGLQRTTALDNMSKSRKLLVKFALLFVALLVMNLIWPYGSGI